MTFANTDAAEFWAGMAPTWVELEDQLEQVGGGPGEWAMDRLSLGPGALVLDVGCGTGRTTLALARRVAPGGQAVGVDISDEMLMRAQEHAEAAGTENVSFVHADAQVHDLGDAAFDAAYSRFGVMFFADPVAAFGNIRRALKPGGSLGFVCWQSVFDNEWMLVPGAAAMAAAIDGRCCAGLSSVKRVSSTRGSNAKSSIAASARFSSPRSGWMERSGSSC